MTDDDQRSLERVRRTINRLEDLKKRLQEARHVPAAVKVQQVVERMERKARRDY